MQIDIATMRDLDEVMDLYNEAAASMEGTAFDCRWREGMHPTRRFVGGLIEEKGLLVARDGGMLVGAVGIDHDLGHDYGPVRWLVDVQDEQVAVVHLLLIREGWRGRGLARELLDASLELARARGMRTARLDATANNAPAIALYASDGFAQVAEGVQEIGPDDDPFVPFVVMERVL